MLYKLVASHLVAELASFCDENDLHHCSQIGGLSNRRTSEHRWNLNALMAQKRGRYEGSAALMSDEPTETGNHIYYLYIYFNKAFNSVPREALREAVITYRVPVWLIGSIFLLYTHPKKFNFVIGCTSARYRLDRGLRQGFPMSPLLFSLYLGLVLFS